MSLLPYIISITPLKQKTISVMGAINMLGLAKRVNAKILQASTSEVYGDPLVQRNQNPIGVTLIQ
jgi:UDP-glucuronate decarboxylase